MRVSGTDEEGREQHADDRHDISDEFRCLESSFGFAATAGGNTSRLRTLRSVGGGGVRTMRRSGIAGGHVVLLLTRPIVCRPVLCIGVNRMQPQQMACANYLAEAVFRPVP